MRPIRLLIVDHSALLRKALSERLAEDPGIEVVGTAPDAYVARDKIVRERPDVVLLGLGLQGMDGVEFLRRLMPQFPIPVVAMARQTEQGKQMLMQALEAGAVDFVTGPVSADSAELDATLLGLRTTIKLALSANVSHWKRRRAQTPKPVRGPDRSEVRPAGRELIAIGASTGGTGAVKEILSQFPAVMPAVVIVQHMPAGFTGMFAKRMNADCALKVKEAEDGDQIVPGCAFVAPGGLHLRVVRDGAAYRAHVADGELACGHRPSVDVLMESVAESVGRHAVGAVLTGMGRDGTAGLKAIRDAGGRTLAQDEATSVVFGMPKEAYESGAAECLVPLDRVADVIMRLLGEMAGVPSRK